MSSPPKRWLASLRHRPALMVFVVVAVAYCVSPAVNVGDSRMSLPTAVSLYRSGDLSLDEFPQVQALADEYDVVRHDGHLLAAYPWPPMLLLTPVAAVVDLVPGVDPAAAPLASPNRTWPYELPVAAALVALAVAICFRAFGGRATRSVIVATVVLAVGTVWWSAASRALSQHAAAAPFIALALLLMVRSRTDTSKVPWLGAAVAGAYAMRPTSAVLVVAVTAWVVLRHRQLLVQYLVRAALVAVPFVAVNLAVYGSVLAPYYRTGKLGVEGDPLGAVAGLLVSPSRGLLLFSPVLLLVPVGVWLTKRGRGLDAVDAVFLSVAVGTFAVAATWPNWWGGSTFGPRLLAEAMPFLCWYLLPVFDHVGALGPGRRRRTAVAACSVLVSLSVLVHSQGAAVRATLCWNSVPEFVDEHPDRVWDWGDPQPLRGVRDLLDGEGLRQVVIGSCKDAGGAVINGG